MANFDNFERPPRGKAVIHLGDYCKYLAPEDYERDPKQTVTKVLSLVDDYQITASREIKHYGCANLLRVEITEHGLAVKISDKDEKFPIENVLCHVRLNYLVDSARNKPKIQALLNALGM